LDSHQQNRYITNVVVEAEYVCETVYDPVEGEERGEAAVRSDDISTPAPRAEKRWRAR